MTVGASSAAGLLNITPGLKVICKQVIHRWKDKKEWIIVNKFFFSKKLKMKKKNGDEKNQLFFYWAEIIHFQYEETSSLADFTSALVVKLQRVKVGQKCRFWSILPLFC